MSPLPTGAYLPHNTASAGYATANVANAHTNNPNNPATDLHDVCGLLKVQRYSNFEDFDVPLDSPEYGRDYVFVPSPRMEAQFERALRLINRTAIGAALLRDIEACEVPSNRRPACVFHESNPWETNDVEVDYVRFAGAPVINFQVLPPTDTENSDAGEPSGKDTPYDGFPDALNKKQAYQLMDLFAELLTAYANNLGRPCHDRWSGILPYRMSVFREEIGYPAEAWRVDMETYVLEEADHGEHRHGVNTIVTKWVYAGDPEAELNLMGLRLAQCPPLHNLDAIRLNLSGNQITAFPPIDRLPPTLKAISLIGNPIETGAAQYPADLEQVEFSDPPGNLERLQKSLPAQVEIVEADAARTHQILRACWDAMLLNAFPNYLGGWVSPAAMRRAGFTDKVTAEILPTTLLAQTVQLWLAPNPIDEKVWRDAQLAYPNESFAMVKMLERLAAMPAAKDTNFRQGFADLFYKMQKPGYERLLDDCLQILGESAASCDDRILDSLNELHIASLNADAEAGIYDRNPDILLEIGQQTFALHAATQFIAKLMPELEQRFEQQKKEKLAQRLNAVATVNPDEELDELEQSLMLQTRLAERNPKLLPAMRFSMQFGTYSILNDNDIERAEDYIEQTRKTELMSFLCTWKPLESFINRTSPWLLKRERKLQEKIHKDRGLVYGLLDRLLKTDGNLFLRRDTSHMMMFPVKYRTFWTVYERQVDRHLTAHDMGHDDDEIVAQAAAYIRNHITFLLRSRTVQQCMLINELPVGAWGQNLEQPRWLKKLL